VYLGHDTQLDRPVALRVHPSSRPDCTWFERLPPDVQRQVRLVEAEMDELVARAGPRPEGVHPLHWKGWVLMKSKKGLNLFRRMGDLFSAHPPTPPADVPALDDNGDPVPPGLLPGWKDGSPAEASAAEGPKPETPPPVPPVKPATVPFVVPPPDQAKGSVGVIERLLGYLPNGANRGEP
jgi:hypothetical protein